MGQKQIQITIRGRVTGVFFEASAQREARRRNLSGWIKSRRPGVLECVVEGEEFDVKDFLSWIQSGPTTARVDSADARWRSYSGEYMSFRIVNS